MERQLGHDSLVNQCFLTVTTFRCVGLTPRIPQTPVYAEERILNLAKMLVNTNILRWWGENLGLLGVMGGPDPLSIPPCLGGPGPILQRSA